MNDTQMLWERTRAAYLEFRRTKRNLYKVDANTHSTRSKRDNAFDNFLKAQSNATLHVEDVAQEGKLIEALREYRSAKINHDAAELATKDILSDFKVVEIKYSVVIFEALRKVFGLTITDLANVFGIWGSSISRWIQSDKDRERREAYDTEFEIEPQDEES